MNAIGLFRSIVMLGFPFIAALVFIPTELFFYNAKDFGENDALIVYPALLCLAILSVVSLLCFLIREINSPFLFNTKWLFLLSGFYLSLADIFAPLQLAQLDGDEVVSTEPLLYTMIELAFLSIILALFFLRKKLGGSLIDGAALIMLCIVGYFAYTLMFVAASRAEVAADHSSSRASTLPNIYHIHLDAMQTDYFMNGLTHYEKVFSGFDLFTKNISNYPYSLPSVASYMTSTLYNSGRYLLWLDTFDKGIFASAKASGYKVTVIGKRSLLESDYIDEFIADSDVYESSLNIKHSQLSQFASLWFARITPNAFTNRGMAIGEKLGAYIHSLVNPEVSAEIPRTIASGIEPYTGKLVLEYARKTESGRAGHGEYVFMQPVLPHSPHIFDEKCLLDKRLGDASKKYMLQVACARRLVEAYLNELRKLGRYENSMIIIHGDHGSAAAGFLGESSPVDKTPLFEEYFPWSKSQMESRASSLLMIKRPLSVTPGLSYRGDESQLLDVYPTLLGVMGEEPRTLVEGRDLYDCAENSCDESRTVDMKFYHLKPGRTEKSSMLELPVHFEGLMPRFGEGTLTDPGGEFLFLAHELPSQLGIGDGTALLLRSDDARSGYITYGPYIELKSGVYEYEYTYSSSASADRAIGKFDVVSDAGRTRLLMRDVYGSDSLQTVLSGVFEIPPGATRGLVIELRMYSSSFSHIRVESLNIKASATSQ